MVTLESIFNTDDEAKKPKSSIQVQQDHYEEVEVSAGKKLKLGKVCTVEEKVSFVQLFNEFSDVFAWEYGDLKGFDPKLA